MIYDDDGFVPNTNSNQFQIQIYHGDPNYAWSPSDEPTHTEQDREMAVRFKRRREDFINDLSPENREIVENLRTQYSCRNDRLCRLMPENCMQTTFMSFSPFTMCEMEILSLRIRHTSFSPPREIDQSDFARYRRFAMNRFFFINGLTPNRPLLNRPYAEQEGLIALSRPTIYRRHSDRRVRRNVEHLRMLRYRQNYLREENYSVTSLPSRRRLLTFFDNITSVAFDLPRSARRSSRYDSLRHSRELRDRSGIRRVKRRRISESEDNSSSLGLNSDSRDSASSIVVLGVQVLDEEQEEEPFNLEKQDYSSQTDPVSVSAENVAPEANPDAPAEYVPDGSNYEDTCNFYMDSLRCKKIKLDNDLKPEASGNSPSSVPAGANDEISVVKRNKTKFSLDSRKTAGCYNFFFTHGEPPLFSL